jgi:hypothetical protein
MILREQEQLGIRILDPAAVGAAQLELVLVVKSLIDMPEIAVKALHAALQMQLRMRVNSLRRVLGIAASAGLQRNPKELQSALVVGSLVPVVCLNEWIALRTGWIVVGVVALGGSVELDGQVKELVGRLPVRNPMDFRNGWIVPLGKFLRGHF